MAKIDAKTIEQVLASLSVEQLTAAAANRRKESLKPLIEEWEKIDAEQDERISKILEIDAEWRPASLGDKIVAWLGEQDEPQTKDEIAKGFPGKNIGLSLAQLSKKNRVVLADGKYTVKK